MFSAGENWDRLESAAHRRAWRLVGANDSPMLLFPDDALVLSEREIYDEALLAVIIFLMIMGFPFREEKLWAKNELIWLVLPIDISDNKCGIFEVTLRFALGELQNLLRIRGPSLNKVQSAGGSLQWMSKMRPWLRPFMAGLYGSAETKSAFQRIRKISPITNLRSGNCFWNFHVLSPRDLACASG